MAATVKELLALPLYQEHVQVASDRGLNNEVSYLTVMEAPDFHIETLDQKTMILTTLSSYYQSIASVNEIIEKLCQAKVAAIAIKCGRFLEKIDDSTVEIAFRYRVPLLVIDRKTYFRQILSESLGAIADQQHIVMQKTILFDNDLQEVIYHNASFEEIIAVFTSRVDCYCCLTDAAQRVLVESNDPELNLGYLDVRKAIEEYLRAKRKDSHTTFWNNGREYLLPCGSQDETNGYFYVCFPEEVDSISVYYLRSLSRTLSIKLFEHTIEEKAKGELAAAILDEILFSENVNEMLTIDRLKLFGFLPQERHVLVLLKPEEDHRAGTLTEAVQNIFSRYAASAIAFEQSDLFIVLLSERAKRTNAQIYRSIEEAAAEVNKLLNGGFCFGVSTIVNKFRQISSCYTQAKKALNYGELMKKEKQCHFYSDYLELGLLSHALHTNTSGILFRDIINPILEYDRKYEMTLWDTLIRCFEATTLDSVAKELFIHISTLRYRLQKIEVLTGYNYFDPKDRMMLYMTYLLYMADQAEQRN